MPASRLLARTAPLAVLLASTACAARGFDPDAIPAREFSGLYDREGGGSWFRSCDPADGPSRWWVTFTGRSVAQADSLRAAGRLSTTAAPSFVRWSAAPTTGGQVGPTGPGARALLVRDIREARPGASSDCDAR